jgi:hypothetical protein
MLTKKQVISIIKEMPDNFETTQLFDRILVLNKIEEGRQQIKDGKGITTEQAKKKLKKGSNKPKREKRELGLMKNKGTVKFIGGHNTTEEEFFGKKISIKQKIPR